MLLAWPLSYQPFTDSQRVIALKAFGRTSCRSCTPSLITQMLPPAELPVRYTDLLLPKWRGRAGMNGNNIMFLAAMMSHFGKENGMDFLHKLAAQSPQVRGGGTLLTTLVAAGEFPIAFSINENNVENFKN